MTQRVTCEVGEGGYFFAEAESIGSTDDEIAAARAGQLPQDKVMAICQNMHDAIDLLKQAETMGRC